MKIKIKSKSFKIIMTCDQFKFSIMTFKSRRDEGKMELQHLINRFNCTELHDYRNDSEFTNFLLS